MPRVTLGDLRARGIAIAQYLFVADDYENEAAYYAIITDPYVIDSTARDLAEAATRCANGEHHDYTCNCVLRARAPERPMLILEQL